MYSTETECKEIIWRLPESEHSAAAEVLFVHTLDAPSPAIQHSVHFFLAMIEMLEPHLKSQQSLADS